VDGNAVVFTLSYRFGANGSLLRGDRIGPVSWTGGI
jgi:hypothetical protein